MAKTVLTFDMGDTYIKIAKKEGTHVTVYSKQMPENLVKDGFIEMPSMMTNFLKELQKEFKLPK